jgi:uracil-DNA glycosylase family 4
MTAALTPPIQPGRDCPLCPRLAAFRAQNRGRFPTWHNAPVPSFGDVSASLLIVGLAPGLRGANATGRPFTGDYAGDLLYDSLLALGGARGAYRERADDGLDLIGCRITNAVRCVPPENKPTPVESNNCRLFLIDEIKAMPNLRVIFALGGIAHNAVLGIRGVRKAHYPFAHGARHDLPDGLIMVDSYHCSRLNTNTGRLTAAMFQTVLGEAMKLAREAS